jgi:hypothetical protein
MDRRALLSVSAAVAVGGCFGLDRSRQSRLAWIWLRNDRDRRYDVDVTVEDGDETVFSDAYQLPATTSETTDIREETPVEGPGRYVVRATMTGETLEVETTEFVDGDEDCIGVRFSLLDDGSVDYWTKSMRQC